MKKVVILGGYGDGLVAAQVIEDRRSQGEKIELVGFLNDHVAPGQKIDGIAVLGAIKSWRDFGFGEDYFFHPALHKVKQMTMRKQLILELGIPNSRMISLIHPTTVIARTASIQQGCLICSFVTIQPGVKIGAFTSIRAGANIGHDAMTQDFCYIGPNATMAGCSKLNEAAHLGPNAVVIDGFTLATHSIAAAGAVIMKDTLPHSIYMGNPARKILSVE